jgi:hypothetical protein
MKKPYLSEEGREGKTVVSSESPREPRYRSQGTEHGDKTEENNEGHKGCGGSFRPSCLIENFDYGISGRGRQCIGHVSDTEKNTDDEGKGQGTVNDDTGNHTLRHSSWGVFHLGACRKHQQCCRQSRQLPDIGLTNSCEGRHRTLCSLSNEALWKTGKLGLTSQRKSARQQSNAPFDARVLPATLPGDGCRENKVRRAPWGQDY